MKIITAIGNPEINEELNKDDFYEVIGVDIQYQDGVFEILELNKNIDYLILNLNIIGELNEIDFIEKIFEENKKLNLIIILEKENEKIINYLFSKNIKNILLKNRNILEEINNIMKNKKEINLFNSKRKKHPPNLVGAQRFLSPSIRKKSATPAFGYIIPQNKIIILFGNKKINKNSFIILFLKLINKKILIIEFINILNKINNEEKEHEIKINKKINLINCNIESLNRNDLKNKFNDYNFIIFNLFNIKEKNKIIEIINLIF